MITSPRPSTAPRLPQGAASSPKPMRVAEFLSLSSRPHSCPEGGVALRRGWGRGSPGEGGAGPAAEPIGATPGRGRGEPGLFPLRAGPIRTLQA